MIVADDVSLLNTSSTVVKQNNDGTISMTVEGKFSKVNNLAF